MTQTSTTHSTFVIERFYNASPSRVFAAWADPSVKAQWFKGPEDWGTEEFELDFRIGGREISRGGPKGGPIHSYEAVYYDIVPNRRIISAYEMHLDNRRISVSLSTIEFFPEGSGTRLVLTEQGAYLEDADGPQLREHGTRELLDAVDALLQRQ